MGIIKRFEVGRLLTPAEADNNFNWLKSTPQTVIISSGIITLNGAGWYIVDTNGIGADNLTRINGVAEGEVVSIRPADPARIITVVHGANLKLRNDANATLNSIYDILTLRSYGSDVLVEFPLR